MSRYTSPRPPKSETQRQVAERLSWLSRQALRLHVRLLLRRLGYRQVKAVKNFPGVDLVARLLRHRGASKIVVRIRDYGPIGLSAVDELQGVMKRTGSEFGMLITTSTFSAPARQRVSNLPDFPIALTDLDNLAALSHAFDLGVRRPPLRGADSPWRVIDEAYFEQVEELSR